MNASQGKSWPADYQDWSGSFDELVATARAIQEEQAPAATLLNHRLVRHYQSVGAVGRGVRNGRASRFGFADLAALLATKGLVEEGWTLSNAAPLANSVPAPALANLTTSYGAFRSPGQSSPGDTAASRLVRELMGSSAPVPSMGSPLRSHSGASFHAPVLLPPLRGAVAEPRPAAPSAVPPQPLHRAGSATVSPWLAVDFDAAAAARATPEQRRAAARALAAWSRRNLG